MLGLFMKPHQRDITNLLAAAVQACHDMVCDCLFKLPHYRFVIRIFICWLV